MIEISHELTHIGIHFKDVFCCDCFFDETYFLLRQKSSYEILRKDLIWKIVILNMVFQQL